jgi:hypothetical protein
MTVAEGVLFPGAGPNFFEEKEGRLCEDWEAEPGGWEF